MKVCPFLGRMVVGELLQNPAALTTAARTCPIMARAMGTHSAAAAAAAVTVPSSTAEDVKAGILCLFFFCILF